MTEEARVAGTDPYESYAYADGPIRIFNQHKALHGQPGDVERYFNLMVAGSQAEIDAWRIERIGEGTVKIEHPDGPRVFGVPRGEAHVGRFRISAEAFALSETSIVLLNGTGLYANETVFESDAPVHLVLYPDEGRGEVRVNEETSVRTEGVCFGGEEDPAPESLLAGTHQFTLETGISDVLHAALRDGTPYAHRRAPRVHGFAPRDTTPLRRLWGRAGRGPGPMRRCEGVNRPLSARAGGRYFCWTATDGSVGVARPARRCVPCTLRIWRRDAFWPEDGTAR